MPGSRREFLGAAGGAALASALPSASGAATPPKVERRVGGDLLSRMSWLNPPSHENYSEGVLRVRSRGKTDFWRKTYYGYINDNGHFMSLPVAGDFLFQARIDGNYGALYDQALALSERARHAGVAARRVLVITRGEGRGQRGRITS